LQNNTVLSIFPDSSSNLWLGLDNGIDFIEINSPVSFISDKDGLGTGYCARVFNGKLYLGTNQGLFVKSFNNFSANIENFELVSHSAGQVWSLGVFDDKLICGHHLGTFEIIGNEAKQLGKNNGGWIYIQPNNKPDLLLGGCYNGLKLFIKVYGTWRFHKNVAGFSESSRFLLQENDTVFWISHGGKGIFRLKLSADLDSVKSYRLYTSKNGLPSDEQNILFQYNGKPYFSTIEGIYEYVTESDSLIPAEKLNKTFNFDGRLKTVKSDTDGNIWFIADNESGVLRLNDDLTYAKITTPFKQLDNRYVNEFEFIYPYNNDHGFIGIDNGFAHYSSKLSKLYSEPFQSFITKIEIPYLDSTLLLYNRELKQISGLPFRKNALRFHFAAPFYEGHSQLVLVFP
jgi:ligand-binding sensor domain-containing protein